MQFTIRHHTRYRSSKPVRLGPHALRFHPREDGSQRVIEYRLDVSPAPHGVNEHIDLEGNRMTQVRFDEATECFDIALTLRVETLRRNAFDFILAPEMTTLPIDHEHDTLCAHAYLERIEINDAPTAFAAELSLSVGRDTLAFLDTLNRRLFADFEQIHRDTGAPQSPAHPRDTMPVSGAFSGEGAHSSLDYTLEIDVQKR
jgi:transglutaminase-like putative cysteine protease